MSKKVKTFALIILGLAAVIWASTFLGNKKSPAPTGAISSNSKILGPNTPSQQPSLEGQNEFSLALSNIKTIDIDTSIFESPAYKALRDFPVALGTDLVGRTNPFAPVGADDQTNVSEVQTAQPTKITSTSAEFVSQIKLKGASQVSLIFEYGPSNLFGNLTSPTTVIKSGGASYRVSGLTPGTIYYVRAILSQGADTLPGNTITFITSPSQ